MPPPHRPGRSSVLATVALAVAAGSTAACGATGAVGAAAPSTSTTTLGPVRTVRIGLLGERDRPAVDGVRLALSQATALGTGLDIVIDTAGGTGSIAGAARRLVADHVAAVIGPETPAAVRVAAPLLAAAGIPALSVTDTAAAPDGYFTVPASVSQQGALLADRVTRGLGDRNVAVVADGSSSDAALAAAAETEVAADGGTVVSAVEDVGAGTAPAAAQTIEGDGATAAICSLPPALATTLVGLLAAGGYTGTVVLATGGDPGVMAPAAEADAAHVEVASPADDVAAVPYPTGDALVFADAYRAAFGSDPQTWAAQAYDAASFVIRAVTSGTTEAEVMAYLRTKSWPGVASTLAFSAGGAAASPVEYLSEVRDGTLVQTGSQP